MIKIFSNPEIFFLIWKKGFYLKQTFTNIKLNIEMLNIFFTSEIRNETMSVITTSIQHHSWGPSQSNKQTIGK